MSDTIYINGKDYRLDYFIPYDASEITSTYTVKWLTYLGEETIPAGEGGTRVSPEVAVTT